MRNQRNNFVPVPTKSVKSTAKNVPKALVPKRSSCSQTERVVLIKEENMTFYPCTRVGLNDGGMRRDYTKAVNYINSCHKFINTVTEKNCVDKNNTFILPMIPNFVPLFSYLVGKKPPAKCKERKDPEDIIKKVPEKKGKPKAEDVRSKSEESRSRCSAPKMFDKPSEPLVLSSHPVGDSDMKPLLQQKTDSTTYATEVADIVRSQIQDFFSALQKDMCKPTKTKTQQEGKPKCKNVKMVKHRLQELSKICCLPKDLEVLPEAGEIPIVTQPEAIIPILPPQVIQNPPQSLRISPISSPPLVVGIPEEQILVLSDLENEETKKEQSLCQEGIKITCYNSNSSIASESSDIKTDSDLEINY